MVNITWNPYGWSRPYINPKAGHTSVRNSPGNESLNFDFNKKGLDDENYVFGHTQWRGQPRWFEKPGIIFFFTRNLDTRQNQIVGVYGNAEIVDPHKKTTWCEVTPPRTDRELYNNPRAGASYTKWNEFKNSNLISSIKAEKEKSLLFPIPLSADPYSEGKRLVPQGGIRYIWEPDLVAKIIKDEIEAVKNPTNRRKNLANYIQFWS